jgi:hypothetical protein
LWMSALPSRADILGVEFDVRYVSEADIRRCQSVRTVRV